MSIKLKATLAGSIYELEQQRTHPMTDIDAIRKTRRYAPRELCALGVESEERYTVATALDAALLAYDAKCEELAQCEREKAAAVGLMEGHAVTIGELEWQLSESRKETAHMRQGLSTVTEVSTQLVRERDAAVRDAERYRWLRARDGVCFVFAHDIWRKGAELDAAIDAQLAALAPPTEQPQPSEREVLP